MKSWKKIAITFFVLLVLIVLQARNPNIKGPFRGILGNFINPFVYYTDKAIGGVGGIWDGYINLVSVHKANENLRKENGELKLDNSLLQEKVAEYERLKKLLKFREFSKLDSIACNVIGRNIKGYLKYAIIDRGTEDGVRRKDPVISYSGLVGMVTEVYSDTAKVEVVLNPGSNVSVMNSRTRTVGIVRGDGRGAMAVDFYDRLDDVKENDVMITSGLGGVYPKGIIVGQVDQVENIEVGLFRNLTLKSNVDFYKLENVLVVGK
ncbi:rod shape-determining protein MreC [Denitrovibrio acetiphilus DSM 12809]|uniref:Cell shape-determining protein MreC n=1 Tax=Denitrovibrio acetiphilus (strain DSM 12809 / NBRC 114555 / N2460) TaxID=522772 RepID=D4H7N8_DENA2|nr:rod shape-determining protein MreC [Denitrovibrio acetiphilus]ADD68037.1 rod shape-determining protein MreC [Denitrovibrio acetiphilus DSM 12809]